jgi:hypothetical protein
MTRALLLPDGWDVKLHQVLVDLYLEAKGHPILKFVTIMNTIRCTDTDKLIFPAPPDPCRQYANRRLQYYIKKGRRPSVPDDALVHLLSTITLDESISLLMNRREALRQGSHIDSDNGTDDDDSDDNDDAELSFTNANNDQAVNEISTALVNLSTSRSSRSMTGTAHVLIESVRQHLNPHGIIFLTGGTNIAPADHGLVSYRYAQIIVQLHHPMDRLLDSGLSIRQLFSTHMVPSPILFLLAKSYRTFNLQLKAVLKCRMAATRSLRVGMMNALIEC